MKIKYAYILLLCTLIISCNSRKKEDVIHSPKFVKIDNLSGNVILLKDPERRLNRIFILPTDVDDSSTFVSSSIEFLTKGRLLIQLNYGCFSTNYSLHNFTLDTIKHRTCNMPFDSMLFLKAYIKYKNFEEFSSYRFSSTENEMDNSIKDSCLLRSIIFTDSSEFKIIKVYQ